MSRIVRTGLAAAVACLALAGGAPAQTACPQGRALNGECVNPALALSALQTAIIFAQPQISNTVYPILPVEDFTYRYPYQLIPNPLQPAPVGTPKQ
jgi:hypothetical protein